MCLCVSFLITVYLYYCACRFIRVYNYYVSTCFFLFVSYNTHMHTHTHTHTHNNHSFIPTIYLCCYKAYKVDNSCFNTCFLHSN